MSIDGKCGLAGAFGRSKVSFDGEKLYVWAFDEERRETRQICITRISEVIDADTGETIGIVDVAEWFSRSRLH